MISMISGISCWDVDDGLFCMSDGGGGPLGCQRFRNAQLLPVWSRCCLVAVVDGVVVVQLEVVVALVVVHLEIVVVPVVGFLVVVVPVADFEIVVPVVVAVVTIFPKALLD